MKKQRVIIILILLAGLTTYVVWSQIQKHKAERLIEGSGTIETTEVQVGSRVGGRIVRIAYEEGDMVKAGATLIELDPYQIPAQRAQLEAELQQAEARLIELRRGPRPQEIASAKAQYQEAAARANLARVGARPEEIAQAQANTRQAQADLENARSNYERFRTLYQRQVISGQEFDAARTTYQTAQQRLIAAQAAQRELETGNRPQEITAAQQQANAAYQQYQLLEAGTRPEEIAAQVAVVESIRAQLDQLNTTAHELAIKSPCECQVSSLNLKPGQLVSPNQTVSTLMNLNDLWVRVYIPEETFGRVKPGDTAVVKVDAYPGRTFNGTVVQIASRAEFTPRNVQTEETRKIQVFGVKVALDNREHLLRPGMPVDVTFNILEPEHK
jgi:HlyD family secretion protein